MTLTLSWESPKFLSTPTASRGHLHPQAETYVILSGVAEMHINDEPPRVMRANEVVHIPGGTELLALNGSSTELSAALHLFGIRNFDQVSTSFRQERKNPLVTANGRHRRFRPCNKLRNAKPYTL